MSAIRRTAALTTLMIGLVGGCGDELGWRGFVWDAGPTTRPDGSILDAGASRDADGSSDARDARDASVADGAADISGDNRLDASADGRVDASFDGDVTFDGDTNLTDAIGDAEAGSDARLDGGPVDYVRAALRAKSATCLPCAEVYCPAEVIGCSSIGGVPDAGGDASVATRSQLCTETLTCLMDTECELEDTTTCYCGSSQRDADGSRGCSTPNLANGVCKSKIERSFETNDPARILDGLASSDQKTGGGWAFLLARCLRDNACTSCFRRILPDASAERDATDKPDVSVDANTPPVDAPVDLNPPLPDVGAEAEASAPLFDADADATDSDEPDMNTSDIEPPPADGDDDADSASSDSDSAI